MKMRTLRQWVGWLMLAAALTTTLVGCGGSAANEAAVAVEGPALVMFYTDG